MKRIQVVEDETHIAQLLASGLTHKGFEVSVARNGLEALKQVAEVMPDAVLLDVRWLCLLYPLAINVPFTAMACLDCLGQAFCHLAQRAFPSPYQYDHKHRLRVVMRSVTFYEV